VNISGKNKSRTKHKPCEYRKAEMTPWLSRSLHTAAPFDRSRIGSSAIKCVVTAIVTFQI
jgi:hypothetical protein